MIEFYINELISNGITYIAPWGDCGEGSVITTDTETKDSGVGPEDLEGACALVDEPPSTRERCDSTSSHGSLQLGATAASVHKPREPSSGKITQISNNVHTARRRIMKVLFRLIHLLLRNIFKTVFIHFTKICCI